ncbi:MAG: alpha/beta hydrolase [Bacteroidia bacterium]|nr:alpha/beta hydrolase [Bacteroidia bacterium]
MGGYVSLAFLEKYPSRLSGICLMHSNPWSDQPEKKANRDREIELVRSGKKNIIASNNMIQSFSDTNTQLMKTEVDRCIQMAVSTPDDGIIAMLEGMKVRPDRSETLKKSILPVLLIFGKYDHYLPLDKALTMTQLLGIPTFLVLENSGHMGFLEESEIASDFIIKNIQSVTSW